MTKIKTTKRALLASVLSLLVCISMLIGSTFAWFTDNVTVSGNKIVSGKLDIELWQTSYKDWMDQPGEEGFAEKNITDSETPVFDSELWEPGYLAYTNLTVKNVGTLAAKINAHLTPIGEVGKLAEVIDVYVAYVPFADMYDSYTIRQFFDGEYVLPWGGGMNMFDSYVKHVGTLAEVLAGDVNLADYNGQNAVIEAGDNYQVNIALKMQETAGNEYQEQTAGEFDIRILATQATVEEDSFDNQYDKNAKNVIVSTQNALEEAIATTNAPIEIVLADGEYRLPAMNYKDIVFSGDKNAVLDATTNPATTGANLTFDGVTVKFANENYRGFTHSEKTVYRDCIIKGKQFLYSDARFVNCTFENSDDYCVWTYGAANVSFKDCTFNTGGKAILVYNEMTDAGFVANITVDGCIFIDDGTLNTVKATVETGTNAKGEGSNTYNITVKNSTILGFALNDEGIATGSKAYGNKNSMDADHLKAVIENVKEMEFNAGDLAIATAEELFAFANDVNVNKNTYSGKKILLLNDIDLKNKAWTPIGQTGATQFLGTFDGNGHTIKNLTVDSSAQTGGTYSSGLFGWIERHGSDENLMAVKNLTVAGADVKGNHNVAVIAGYLIGTIENCHVKNATVTCNHANDDACGDKAGVIAGIAAEANALIKNCSAANSTVTAGRDAGQIVGACIVGKVEDCEATNVTVAATGDCTGKNINNALIGRTN